MKCSTQAAVAIGVGYLLGRRRKLRTATVLAAATAVGGTSVGGMALRQGAKLLANSGVLDKMPPQVADLVDVVRGDLVNAGKAAATAAVTKRIDALTDSLHDRAERIRNPEEAVAEGADAATGAARDTGKRAAGAARGAAGAATRRRRGRDLDSERADEEPAEDATDEDEEPEGNYDPYDDRDEAGEDDAHDVRDEADEDEDEKPAKRSVPAQRTAARRRPVASRTRR
jgi:hypothetical protein